MEDKFAEEEAIKKVNAAIRFIKTEDELAKKIIKLNPQVAAEQAAVKKTEAALATVTWLIDYAEKSREKININETFIQINNILEELLKDKNLSQQAQKYLQLAGQALGQENPDSGKAQEYVRTAVAIILIDRQLQYLKTSKESDPELTAMTENARASLEAGNFTKANAILASRELYINSDENKTRAKELALIAQVGNEKETEAVKLEADARLQAGYCDAGQYGKKARELYLLAADFYAKGNLFDGSNALAAATAYKELGNVSQKRYGEISTDIRYFDELSARLKGLKPTEVNPEEAFTHINSISAAAFNSRADSLEEEYKKAGKKSDFSEMRRLYAGNDELDKKAAEGIFAAMRLGVEMHTLKNPKYERQFDNLAKEYAKIPNQEEKSARLSELDKKAGNIAGLWQLENEKKKITGKLDDLILKFKHLGSKPILDEKKETICDPALQLAALMKAKQKVKNATSIEDIQAAIPKNLEDIVQQYNKAQNIIRILDLRQMAAIQGSLEVKVLEARQDLARIKEQYLQSGYRDPRTYFQQIAIMEQEVNLMLLEVRSINLRGTLGRASDGKADETEIAAAITEFQRVCAKVNAFSKAFGSIKFAVSQQNFFSELENAAKGETWDAAALIKSSGRFQDAIATAQDLIILGETGKEISKDQIPSNHRIYNGHIIFDKILGTMQTEDGPANYGITYVIEGGIKKGNPKVIAAFGWHESAGSQEFAGAKWSRPGLRYHLSQEPKGRGIEDYINDQVDRLTFQNSSGATFVSRSWKDLDESMQRANEELRNYKNRDKNTYFQATVDLMASEKAKAWQSISALQLQPELSPIQQSYLGTLKRYIVALDERLSLLLRAASSELSQDTRASFYRNNLNYIQTIVVQPMQIYINEYQLESLNTTIGKLRSGLQKTTANKQIQRQDLIARLESEKEKAMTYLDGKQAAALPEQFLRAFEQDTKDQNMRYARNISAINAAETSESIFLLATSFVPFIGLAAWGSSVGAKAFKDWEEGKPLDYKGIAMFLASATTHGLGKLSAALERTRAMQGALELETIAADANLAALQNTRNAALGNALVNIDKATRIEIAISGLSAGLSFLNDTAGIIDAAPGMYFGAESVYYGIRQNSSVDVMRGLVSFTQSARGFLPVLHQARSAHELLKEHLTNEAVMEAAHERAKTLTEETARSSEISTGQAPQINQTTEDAVLWQNTRKRAGNLWEIAKGGFKGAISRIGEGGSARASFFGVDVAYNFVAGYVQGARNTYRKIKSGISGTQPAFPEVYLIRRDRESTQKEFDSNFNQARSGLYQTSDGTLTVLGPHFRLAVDATAYADRYNAGLNPAAIEQTRDQILIVLRAQNITRPPKERWDEEKINNTANAVIRELGIESIRQGIRSELIGHGTDPKVVDGPLINPVTGEHKIEEGEAYLRAVAAYDLAERLRAIDMNDPGATRKRTEAALYLVSFHPDLYIDKAAMGIRLKLENAALLEDGNFNADSLSQHVNDLREFADGLEKGEYTEWNSTTTQAQRKEIAQTYRDASSQLEQDVKKEQVKDDFKKARKNLAGHNIDLAASSLDGNIEAAYSKKKKGAGLTQDDELLIAYDEARRKLAKDHPDKTIAELEAEFSPVVPVIGQPQPVPEQAMLPTEQEINSAKMGFRRAQNALKLELKEQDSGMWQNIDIPVLMKMADENDPLMPSALKAVVINYNERLRRITGFAKRLGKSPEELTGEASKPPESAGNVISGRRALGNETISINIYETGINSRDPGLRKQTGDRFLQLPMEERESVIGTMIKGPGQDTKKAALYLDYLKGIPKLEEMMGLPKNELKDIFLQYDNIILAGNGIYVHLGKKGITLFSDSEGVSSARNFLSISLSGNMADYISKMAPPGSKITGFNYKPGLFGAYELKLETPDGKQISFFIKKQDLRADQLGARCGRIAGIPTPEIVSESHLGFLKFTGMDGLDSHYGIMENIGGFEGTLKIAGREMKVSALAAQSLDNIGRSEYLYGIFKQRPDLFWREFGFSQTAALSTGMVDGHEGNVWAMLIRVPENEAAILQSKGYETFQAGDSKVIFRMGRIDTDSGGVFWASKNTDGNYDFSSKKHILDRYGSEDVKRVFEMFAKKEHVHVEDIVSQAYPYILEGARQWNLEIGHDPNFRLQMQKALMDHDGKPAGFAVPLSPANILQIKTEAALKEEPGLFVRTPFNGRPQTPVCDVYGRTRMAAKDAIDTFNAMMDYGQPNNFKYQWDTIFGIMNAKIKSEETVR